jgi:hypothetical protein
MLGVFATLPPEAHTGKAELMVTIEQPAQDNKQPRTSLADWAETNAENWGKELTSEDVEGFTGRRS